jgi:succinyl-CoA synthetase beta subunit
LYGGTHNGKHQPHEFSTVSNSHTDTGAAIIKAQVLTGGRGKGYFDNGFQGGVKFLDSPTKAAKVAKQMLGAKLHTKQAPKGLPCHKVLLRECFDIQRELYLSIILDRKTGGPLVVVSPCGGTSIEEVAETNPELIFTEEIDIATGVTGQQCHNVAKYLDLEPNTQSYDSCIQLVRNLSAFFLETDSLQIEINPLAQTPEGRLVVADAKWVVDDKAAERQSHIFAQRDTSQEDPREVFASHYGLNYVGLEGSVGCLVNGAGLSMANMDLLELKGISPACFLDVGGAAKQSAIDAAFAVLEEDPNVKVIFVNIFGGIVRCDEIAEGLIRASRKVTKPMVVRLEGNHASEGMELLDHSGVYNIIVEKDWSTAADKVVQIAQSHETYSDVVSYMLHTCEEEKQLVQVV